jgi:hypothetical protein
MWWAQLLVRAFATFVGVLLILDGIHGLRGRPLIVPKGRGDHTPAHEARGWSARFYGILALVFALVVFALVFSPWVE